MRKADLTCTISRSRRGWASISLVLALGMVFPPAPATAQETDDQSLEFEALAGKKKNRKRQSRPIQMGSSGGNAEDFGNVFCCSGTLGALVEKDGVQYILSNNHVLGRSNSGKRGEAIIQPGNVDQEFCPVGNDSADTVAHLAGRKKIKWGLQKKNKVDLAIAEVVPGAVRPDGKIVHIGIPGSTPKEAYVGMQVIKSGRTTGLTRGFVFLVGVTLILEDSPVDCDGTKTKDARFVDQIIVASNNNRKFGGSGDSGSMLYEDVSRCPSPVGLIFGGSEDGSLGAANPASEVIKAVKKIKPRGAASFVGCEAPGLEATSNRTPRLSPHRVREASGAMRDWEDRLLEVQGVHGVGIGMTLSGQAEPAIYILTTEDRDQMIDQIPETVDGFRVEVIRTDQFVAY